MNSCADALHAARFQVDVEYDGTDLNEGRARIVQGMMVLLPLDKMPAGDVILSLDTISPPAGGCTLWKTFWYEKEVGEP